ncbi:MAG: TonB family protein [Saprospiraceae bacterium]|nr:TonB family protein [Saprospiraceae bacterium]
MKNRITILRRWLSGEGRASDERALDAAMRDDPFLAEAIEGYRAFADADHDKNLTRLRGRLQEKSNQKRPGGVYLLPRAIAIAASVLVLAGMGWWIFRETPEAQMLSKNDTPGSLPADTGTDQAIAQLEQPVPAASIEEPAVPAPTTLYRYNRRSKELNVVPITPAPVDQADRMAENTRAADFALSGEGAAKPKTSDKLAEQPLPVVPSDNERDIATYHKPATESAAPAMPGKRAREEAKKDMADANKSAKEKQSNNLRNLVGRVTDASGEPLIGVSVVAEGTGRSASTDVEGNFSLPLSGDEQQVVFNYTGFESLVAPINQSGSVNVVMKESAVALEEVIGSSFEKKQSKAQSVYKAPATAAPVGGTDAYEAYLAQNLRYPDAARKKGIQGVVKLRFTVSAAGNLSNFKVLQKLGYGCDDEAIRLIKEGSAWQISGDARKVQVEWEIRF